MSDVMLNDSWKGAPIEDLLKTFQEHWDAKNFIYAELWLGRISYRIREAKVKGEPYIP